MSGISYAICALCALSALSCTDPRSRPVPPLVQISFAPSIEVTSPDTILGSLYAFDDDGFTGLRLRASTDDSLFAIDSQIIFVGFPEATRAIHLILPAGIPLDTRLTIIATVEDLAGFVTTDSTSFRTVDVP